MLSILSTSHNPAFNLATEEYLLNNMTEDIVYLYRNGPSVIVGSHQNTLAEINYDYIQTEKTPVVRRLSGGGAVFHDLGNLNFCFITTKEDGKERSFQSFTAPIIAAIQDLGIDAKFTGRNDLTIEDKKFSGNAQYINKSRVLHHGTLLFSANMADLSKALKVNPLKFQDKKVKSVRSRVTNISSHLPEAMTIEAFTDYMTKSISKEAIPYTLTEEDCQAIDTLVQDKYANWDWTYGKQGTFHFTNSIRCPGGTVEYYYNTKKGYIEDLKIHGDFFSKKPTEELTEHLMGTRHEEEALYRALEETVLDDYIIGCDLDSFVKGFF